MSIIGFGKNDRKIMSGGDIDKYRGEKGRKDIISLCWFFEDDDGNPQIGSDFTPKMISSEIHYIPGKGYILDNDYLRSKLGVPKRKIGTFVVHYRTDRRGEFIKPLEFEVKPWTFGEDKYRELAARHGRFNLTMHDLEVTCTDDNFQKLDFIPLPGGAVWQKKDSLKEEVLQTVKDLQDRLEIGREVPLDELKEHFGDNAGLAPDTSTVTDYDDLMEGIE